MTKSGTTITATVSFTAKVPTYFMGIMGYSNVAVSGTSTASYTLPTYINFYLMLDVSGSMSFPSTAAEQTRLKAVNPDNLGNPLSQRLSVRVPFYRAGRLRATRSDAKSIKDRSRAVGNTHEPMPGRLLPGIYHFAPGDHADSFQAAPPISTNGNNINWSNTQVTSCSDRRNHVVHPIARRCRRLCGDHIAVTAATTENEGSPINSRSGSIRLSQYLYGSI